MDFARSQEHELLSHSLSRYLAEANPPEARSKAAFTAPYHAPALWQGLADLGVQGAFLTPQSGGYGGGAEDIRVIFEEIGRSLCAEPLLGSLITARLLERLGHTAALEGFVAGEKRFALAVFEPEVATSLEHLTARAEPCSAGYRLHGRKSAVYGAPSARDVFVVARLEERLSLFHLAKPQLIAAAMVDGGGIADILLAGSDAVLISRDIGSALEEALDLGRLALCAEAVGAAEHLFHLTKDYLTQRKQFGQTLSSFQALQHRLVDMLVELEQMRSITLSASACFAGPHRARHVAMAKALVGKSAKRIAEEAIQLHGGIGMTWDYAGSHYAKRLVMLDHQLGDHFDHLRRLAAL